MIKRKNLKSNKKEKIELRANGICEREGCDNLIENDSEIHHIIPIQFEGSDELNNLALICKKCHDEISKDYQDITVQIPRWENFLIKNPYLIFERKNRILKRIDRLKELKKNLSYKYKFKNRIN
ncbi:HNH endonuclease [Candidatus Pacearchaeota archaeon]|nr:HNH endonuclease [Candidatus Pacearchaeota archaeon]